jgi:cell division protein FtsB
MLRKMNLPNLNTLLNLFFIFMIFYLIHHSLNGKYNVQNYLITKFEKKMYEDFRYNLKQDTVAINLDILALWNKDADMIDEIQKKNNPTPREGEIVLKID